MLILKYRASVGGEMNTGGTAVMLPIYSLGRPNIPTHLPGASAQYWGHRCLLLLPPCDHIYSSGSVYPHF